MFSSLEEITLKYNMNFNDEHNKYINEILDVFNGKIDKYKNSEDRFILNMIGIYYHFMGHDSELMKKYYLMAIELGYDNAMYNLGRRYHFVEKNYELMKKYYLMAIDLGQKSAMNDLGYYYHFTEKNYDLMKKYYLMAIELGNYTAMNNLSHYYRYIERNHEMMKKYYSMAIESGYDEARIALSDIKKYYYLGIYKNKRDVNIFKNKVSMNSKEQECGICDRDELCIPLECSHFVCRDCYIKFYDSKCPFCRMEF
jgi:hypothetical protein